MHRRKGGNTTNARDEPLRKMDKSVPFRRNERVACIALPTLVFLLGVGGGLMTGSMTIGMLLVYLCDLLGSKGAALATAWGTLLSMDLGLMFVLFYDLENRTFASTSTLLMLCGLYFFACGCWISLQFQWIHHHSSILAAAMEDVITWVMPIVCPVILTWAIIPVVGIESLPYFLLAVLIASQLAFWNNQKTPSDDQHVEHRGMEDQAILNDSFRLMVHSAGIILLPNVFYLGAHVDQSKWLDHVGSVALLTSLATMSLAATHGHRVFFFSQVPQEQTARYYKVMVIASSLGVILGLERCVIFVSFVEYIWLSPPWSYFCVAASLSCFAAAARLMWCNIKHEQRQGMVPSIVLLLFSVATAGISLGIPFTLLALSLVGAYGLGVFVYHPTLRSYAMFCIGLISTVMWFLKKHFWFLDLKYGRMDMQTVCVLIAANLLSGVICTYAVSRIRQKSLLGAVFAGYLTLFVLLEAQLYVSGNAEEGFYPSYLFAATGFVSMLAVIHLHRIRIMASEFLLLSGAVCFSKIPLLVFPGGMEVLHTCLLLLMAVSLPFMLSNTRLAIRTATRACMFGMLIVFAVLKTRFLLFDAVYWVKGGRPSDGFLVGCLLLLSVVAFAPFTFTIFRDTRKARKLLVILSLFSLLILLLEPPFPVQSGAECPNLPFGLCPRLWDEEHIPEHLLDDTLIYGGQARGAHQYSVWLLVAAFMVLLLGFSRQKSSTQSRPRTQKRNPIFQGLLYVSFSGALVGGYVALEFFVGSPLLQILVCISCMSCALFLASIMSTSWNSFQLKMLFSSLMATYLLCLMGNGVSTEQEGTWPEFKTREEFRSQQHVAIYVVHACIFGLMAFVIKINMSRLFGRQTSKFDMRDSSQKRRLVGEKQVMKHKTFSLLTFRELAKDGKLWLPVVGNISTVTSYVSALFASHYLVGNADGAAFLIAPILLLLNQDPLFFQSFTLARRYLPVALSVSCYLLLNSCSHLFLQMFTTGFTLAGEAGSSAINLFKNWMCLVFTLPSQAAFTRYLTNMTWRDNVSILVMPLNVPVLFLTDVSTIKILAALGIGEFCIQQFSRRQIRKVGLRVV